MEGLKIKLKVEEMIQYGYAALRQYEIWARHLAEIGKMIGGWMRWLKLNPPGHA